MAVSFNPLQCRVISAIRSMANALKPTNRASMRARPILTWVRIVMQCGSRARPDEETSGGLTGQA